MDRSSAPAQVRRLAAAVLAVVAASTAGSAGSQPLWAQASPVADRAALLSAPYQVEGFERAADGGALAAVIGLGRAPALESPGAGIPMPASEELEWTTLIGTEGWVHASRLRVERRCEYLCGNAGPEECRWVGLYAPQGADDIGDVVAALPGRLELDAFTSLEPSIPSSIPSEPDSPAYLDTADAAVSLLWDEYASGMTLRVTEWDAATGRIAALLGSDYADDHTIAADDCRAVSYDWLLAVDCGGFAILASGGTPLLVSLGDYNRPAVEPIARFEAVGSRHYVVRFGAKAQDVVGLVSAEPAGWRARFRSRDWAQMC